MDVSFNEESARSAPAVERRPRGIAGLVIKLGLARDRREAERVMLIIAAAAAVAAAAVFFFSSAQTQNPPQQLVPMPLTAPQNAPYAPVP